MSINIKKTCFFLITLSSFIAILIFNILTPMMSDDFRYFSEASKATNLWNIIMQEYEQYIHWTGRSVGHFILRCLMQFDKVIFNIANSLCFTWLILLIYWNIKKEETYNIPLYLFVNLLVWLYSVEFGQTILWETGACNYLWPMMLILSFLTIFRYTLNYKYNNKKMFLFVGILLTSGIIAGWCNENTSGGLFLFVLITLFTQMLQKKKIGLHSIAALIGVGIGLFIMISAPGNALRMETSDERHSGILGIISRFLQITNSIKENFYMIIIAIIIFSIIIRFTTNVWCQLYDILLWSFIALATSYALILTAPPMNRAYFGVGIYLCIACGQAFALLQETDLIWKIMKYSIVSILLLNFTFSYIEGTTQLARIYTYNQNRIEYINEQKSKGITSIQVEPFPEVYATKYSFLPHADITQDKESWYNIICANHFKIEEIYLK